MHKNEAISYQDLMTKASGIAERFKIIYFDRLSCLNLSDDDEDDELYEKKRCINLMIVMYNVKPHIDNVHDFWLQIYDQIKIIPSINEQGKKYNELTKSLNPGQLVQCDFYRAIQTFADNQFEILQVKELLENFQYRFWYGSPAVYKFVVRKNNWIALVNFYDDFDCISGILRPEYIINMETSKEHHGEDFYAWNSLEINTNSMIQMFDIGYNAMNDKRYGHIIKLNKFLSDENYIRESDNKNKIMYCYLDRKMNKCYYVIYVPTINPLKFYLHFDNFPNKLILSQTNSVYVKNSYKIGICGNQGFRYLVMDFDTNTDFNIVKQQIDSFLLESHPEYLAIYISDDI